MSNRERKCSKSSASSSASVQVACIAFVNIQVPSKLAEQCSKIIRLIYNFYKRQAKKTADDRCADFARLCLVFGDINPQRVVDESPPPESLPPLNADLIDELAEFVVNLKSSVSLVYWRHENAANCSMLCRPSTIAHSIGPSRT